MSYTYDPAVISVVKASALSLRLDTPSPIRKKSVATCFLKGLEL